MAQGRSRNSKRATNSSYNSTITTIVFIALCVFGVWMLTSSSLAPPKAAKRVSDSSSRNGDAGYSSRSRVEKMNSNPVYEDGPGELSDEVLEKEDHNHHDAENNNAGDDGSATSQSDAVGAGNSDEGQETVSTTTSEETEGKGNDQNKADNENQQPVDETEKQVTDQNENQQPMDETEMQVTDQNENQQPMDETEKQVTVQNENQQPMDETEKQVTDQNENQASEEGSATQNQQENNDESASRISESSVEAHNSAQEEHDSSTEQVLELPSEVQESEGNKGREDNPAQDNPRDEGFSTEDNKHMENSTGTSQEQKPEQMEEDQGAEKSEPDHSTMSGEREETQQKDDGAQGESSKSSHSSSNDVQDSQNAMPEDDPQKRIEEQQQQRKEDQLAEDSTQQQPDSSGAEQEEQQDDTEQQQQQQEVIAQSAKEDSSFPGGDNIPKESKESKKSWATQADQSENQKERRQTDSEGDESIYGYSWQLCNTTAGADYIPCLDNEKALRTVHITGHYEHRERHCPEEGPTCLVPVPEGYQKSIEWPKSREKIWYHNVPHPLLASVKGHQNWVKVTGEFLTFPGGGTQFIHGALHYIDFLQTAEPNIKWGKHTRVILDVGCGVASFGGFQFERDVLTMSFAPKDEHEAQVQFALERGIPAISAVMGTQRLPFPSRVFDLVHCARCRVPWHIEGGRLLLELNRVLRPGGFFVWSATPVYQKLEEDVQIWKAMSALTASMCWELVTIQKDALNSIGAAIFRKPRSNTCYEERKQNVPPMCKDDDDPNAAWYVPLQACMHRVPTDVTERGARWPVVWPRRLRTAPAWLNSSQIGIYGKPAPQDFQADYEHWKQVVSTSYMSNLGISWSGVRNVMDMRAVYGGFAAALKDLQMWVMNVVNIDSPDTLPIIYERGLFGIYHDWCESFSTYPRTYDLLHADHLFSKLKKRCKLAPVLAEVDRIVRPGGKLIVRDESGTIGEVENLLKSLHWEIHLTFSKNQEGILSAQKGNWRPNTFAEKS